jgi:putative endonuclease
MPHARRRLGNRGEQLARRFLMERGYVVLAANYTCQAGEVDLICRDGDVLAFVEVKTRRGDRFGAPEEAVTAMKIAHLASAAESYMAEYGEEGSLWRIDVVAVALGPAGGVDEIRLIRGAGEW